MPGYDNSPFKPIPRLLIPGQNSYLLGSWRQDASPTQFQVATVAIAADVATVTGTVTGGDIPLVGGLISIRGTQTSSGAFNVTNAALTAVTFTPATSAITVTFALTAANVATTADSGLAIVPISEVPETVANGASIACTPQNNETFLEVGRLLSTTVTFPTLPTTATVVLQGANFDTDSEYTTIDTVATVTAGAQTTPKVTEVQNNGGGTTTAINSPVNYRFYRFLVSGVTGTGTIIARIEG
jgi:hypothetical protein